MKIFGTIKNFVKERPLEVIVWKTYCKITGAKIPNFNTWRSTIDNREGLEIGGPSGIFGSRGFLPIYPHIKSLDGVNFSSDTIWEGHLSEGDTYKFANKTGRQFIMEGTILSQIPDNSYDFLLSCNNLEHVGNPLKALFEWKRVIKSGGSIILIVPRKESNFDHKRVITPFDHIKKDYKNQIGEDDLTHLPEILLRHDLTRDPHAGNLADFRQRAQNNYTTRSIHHHVFDFALLHEMIDYVGMNVILEHASPTDYIIAAIR